MGAIHFDESRWPLVILAFDGIPTDKEFEAYLSQMLLFFHRRERHGYVVDTRRGGLLPRGQRQRQGEWLKEHKELITLYSTRTAIVMTSPVLRFVLATIYLIQPPFVPTEIFSTMEQATAWVEGCLKEPLS
jgi:hypothetical protein